MAKSTMEVVPPKAAARVPVSKSSADVVPPKGMSRCVCTSMPPGSTYMPAASTTVAPSVGMPGRTSLIFSPEIRMSAGVVEVAVTTAPLRMRVSGTGPHLPRFPRPARLDLLHRDAVLYRAHQPAEITSHAFILVDSRNARCRSRSIRKLLRVEFRDRRGHNSGAAAGLHGSRRRLSVEMNALVGAVPTRHIAQIAADAFIAIDARDDFVIQIQVLPIGDLGQRETSKVIHRPKALLVHPVAEPVDHVLDDAEAVVHGCRAYLDCAAAQEAQLRAF